MEIYITQQVENKKQYLETLDAAYDKVKQVLPLDAVEFDVIVRPGKSKPGVIGFALPGNVLDIVIDQSKPLDTLIRELEMTFYHELYHIVRYGLVGRGKVLEHLVIHEGLAVAFEAEMGGNVDRMNFKPGEKTVLIAAYKVECDGDEWLATNAVDWSPRTLNSHKVGYHLVKQYMKEHGKKASELIGSKDLK